MFIGHFALGFAAKKAEPEVSLGTLFLAAQWADLLWPALLLTGVERMEIHPDAPPLLRFEFLSYPVSHSLLALILWGALFALAHRAIRRSRASAGLLLAGLVVSHWALDFATHRPDMPVWPGGPRFGLGLWNSMPATVIVESVLFVAGVAIYARATEPADRVGTFALGALVIFLAAMYASSLAAPPPPSVKAVAWGTLAMWLLVAWGSWIDRHRKVRAGSLPKEV